MFKKFLFALALLALICLQSSVQAIDWVQLDDPINNTNSSGTNDTIYFAFNYTDIVNLTAACTLYLNGANVSHNATTLNGTNTTLRASLNRYLYERQEANTWYVYCANGSDTNTSNTWNIYIDRTAPGVLQTSPANNSGSTVAGTLLYFTATEHWDTTVNCSLWIDGAYNSSNSTTYPGISMSFNYTPSSQGNFTWNVSCLDKARNMGSGLNRTVVNDWTDPQPVLITPVTGARTNASSISFIFNYTDNVDTVLPCEIQVNISGVSQAIAFNASSLNATTTTIATTELSLDGYFEWNVSCTDFAGNTNLSFASNVLRIDRTDPIVLMLNESQVIPTGWRWDYINVTTNENSTCYWNSTAFDFILDTGLVYNITNAAGTTHGVNVSTNVSTNNTQTFFYTKCLDLFNNTATTVTHTLRTPQVKADAWMGLLTMGVVGFASVVYSYYMRRRRRR